MIRLVVIMTDTASVSQFEGNIGKRLTNRTDLCPASVKLEGQKGNRAIGRIGKPASQIPANNTSATTIVLLHKQNLDNQC